MNLMNSAVECLQMTFVLHYSKCSKKIFKPRETHNVYQGHWSANANSSIGRRVNKTKCNVNAILKRYPVCEHLCFGFIRNGRCLMTYSTPAKRVWSQDHLCLFTPNRLLYTWRELERNGTHTEVEQVWCDSSCLFLQKVGFCTWLWAADQRLLTNHYYFVHYF